MKKYLSFFRIRFQNGMQYRAAAVAGMVTQFAWGFLEILLYRAFYQADPTAFPMAFDGLVSYIWMQQAFLALFMSWLLDSDIFDLILSGNVAYELCRPASLYGMWFTRNMANRLAKAVLRCFPILLVAFFLPEPYRMTLPKDPAALLLFLLTMVLAFLLVIAFNMTIYAATFFTIAPQGVRTIAVMLADFLSGSLLPLPFFPEGVRRVISLLPFAAMQNVPLRIYSGDIVGTEIGFSILLQLFWLAALVLGGELLMRRALRNVVVQGG